jgi:cell division protein FtsN
MPRDYKNSARKRNKRTSLSPLVGVIGGLLIGLFVAFLVYIKMQEKPDPHVYLQESIPAPAASTAQDVRDVPKDQVDAIPPPPKPRFDFYTLLPEMEVVIPEQEITAALKQPPAPVQKAAPVIEATPVATDKPVPETVPAPDKTGTSAAGDTYYLQVGSFRNSVQAERFKAELALQGMQTSIQTVTINNKDTYHRVRVGPFNNFDALDKTRQSLKKKGIDSTPIKVTG